MLYMRTDGGSSRKIKSHLHILHQHNRVCSWSIPKKRKSKFHVLQEYACMCAHNHINIIWRHYQTQKRLRQSKIKANNKHTHTMKRP